MVLYLFGLFFAVQHFGQLDAEFEGCAGTLTSDNVVAHDYVILGELIAGFNELVSLLRIRSQSAATRNAMALQGAGRATDSRYDFALLFMPFQNFSNFLVLAELVRSGTAGQNNSIEQLIGGYLGERTIDADSCLLDASDHIRVGQARQRYIVAGASQDIHCNDQFRLLTSIRGNHEHLF